MDKKIKTTLLVIGSIVAVSLLVYGVYAKGKSSHISQSVSAAPVQSVAVAAPTVQTQPAGATTPTTSFGLQAQCSTQAEIFFNSSKNPNRNEPNVSYTDHYNSKLNKCFVLITDYDTSPATTDSDTGVFEDTMTTVDIDLYDAFENTEYASYFGTTSYGATGTSCPKSINPADTKSNFFLISCMMNGGQIWLNGTSDLNTTPSIMIGGGNGASTSGNGSSYGQFIDKVNSLFMTN